MVNLSFSFPSLYVIGEGKYQTNKQQQEESINNVKGVKQHTCEISQRSQQ
jgi:hypothetical protein